LGAPVASTALRGAPRRHGELSNARRFNHLRGCALPKQHRNQTWAASAGRAAADVRPVATVPISYARWLGAGPTPVPGSETAAACRRVAAAAGDHCRRRLLRRCLVLSPVGNALMEMGLSVLAELAEWTAWLGPMFGARLDQGIGSSPQRMPAEAKAGQRPERCRDLCSIICLMRINLVEFPAELCGRCRVARLGVV
jgi:hypothetical protein